MLKTSHAANHYLDTEVYAFAAADIMGVRQMFLRETEPEKEKQPEKPQEEPGWLQTGENWLG